LEEAKSPAARVIHHHYKYGRGDIVMNNWQFIRILLLTVAFSIPVSPAAALSTGSVLSISPGNCPEYNDGPLIAAGTGSCFGMDIGDGTLATTNIAGHDGIIIGASQPASGSHFGSPDGSESPGIDAPWVFFSYTGMHLTTLPVTAISQSGDTAVLDFSGWSMAWYGVPLIDLGSGAHAPGFIDGQAQMTCSLVGCPNGSAYSLLYTATIPPGDPSGLGGIRYSLRLEGTIVPLPAAVWLLAGGLLTLGATVRRRR
jgi:hypothetical protein